VSDTEYQKQVSNTETTITVRHNYRQHTVCCDLLVSGDLHAADLDYEWVGSKPEFCLGAEYILLREEFRRITRTDAVWNDPPARAVIVMGGSDIKNVTPTVIDAFEGLDGCVDVVVGPGFSNTNEIQQTAAAVDTECRLLFDPENMAEIMHRADIAVTTCGGTVFELLAARTPFVGLSLVDNQQQRAAALQDHELALITDEIETVPQRIEELLAGDCRKRLYDRIEGVVDGNGARRVYDALCRAVQSS
jgi:spore coat polysaccharide biosynthesis predicted glycosyltransferase SpsG